MKYNHWCHAWDLMKHCFNVGQVPASIGIFPLKRADLAHGAGSTSITDTT